MKKGYCIHFNGIECEICKKGIKYSDVMKGNEKGAFFYPCVKKYSILETVTCPEYQDPTDEQVENSLKEQKERLTLIESALYVIRESDETRGVIKCPKCGNELHFVKHENRHIWGKCKTPDCLGWMM